MPTIRICHQMCGHWRRRAIRTRLNTGLFHRRHMEASIVRKMNGQKHALLPCLSPTPAGISSRKGGREPETATNNMFLEHLDFQVDCCLTCCWRWQRQPGGQASNEEKREGVWDSEPKPVSDVCSSSRLQQVCRCMLPVISGTGRRRGRMPGREKRGESWPSPPPSPLHLAGEEGRAGQ